MLQGDLLIINSKTCSLRRRVLTSPSSVTVADYTETIYDKPSIPHPLSRIVPHLDSLSLRPDSAKQKQNNDTYLRQHKNQLMQLPDQRHPRFILTDEPASMQKSRTYTDSDSYNLDLISVTIQLLEVPKCLGQYQEHHQGDLQSCIRFEPWIETLLFQNEREQGRFSCKWGWCAVRCCAVLCCAGLCRGRQPLQLSCFHCLWPPEPC